GDGSTVGQLTLTVARPSATTPGAKLELCPLTTPTIVPDQGGPMSEAPGYSCNTKVTASPDKSGNTYAFSAGSLAAQGVLAVAILPTDPTTRVVFSQPGPSSLAVTAPASAPLADTSTPPPRVST